SSIRHVPQQNTSKPHGERPTRSAGQGGHTGGASCSRQRVTKFVPRTRSTEKRRKSAIFARFVDHDRRCGDYRNGLRNAKSSLPRFTLTRCGTPCLSRRVA